MTFRCTSCGHETGPATLCDRCDGFVRFSCDDPSTLQAAIEGDFWAALPPVSERIELGEANTPHISLDSEVHDGIAIDSKLESLNPTCSFKDRGSALTVSMAADPETTFEAVVVASTGNTATSVAAYAASADVPCAIVMPEGTSMAKLSQAYAHGASVFTVDGTFSDCFSLAQQVSNNRIINGTAVYSANPFVASANRTIAFEILCDYGDIPDWISVPVGAGPLLGGTYAGFTELYDHGIIESTPKMLCVQSHGCHPVVEAFEHNRVVRAWDEPITTDVGAIADPLRGYPEDGEHTRQSVLESDGHAVALSDSVVHRWTEQLARTDGIYAEPASAASVAGVVESNAVKPGETAVALITGHGLKEPSEAEPTVTAGATVDGLRTELLG